MAETKVTKTAADDDDVTNRVGANFDPVTLKSRAVSWTMQLGAKTANQRVCRIDLRNSAPAPTEGILRLAIDALSFATIKEQKVVTAKNKNKAFGTLASTDTIAYVAYFKVTNDDGEEDQKTVTIPYCPDLSVYAAMDAKMRSSEKDIYFGGGWTDAVFLRSAPAVMKRSD